MNDFIDPVSTIIFSGADGVGKTTLKNAFDKATQYKYTLFDRGPIDTYVYALMAQRHNEDRCIKTFKQMLPHSLFVVVTAKVAEINKRMIERGDNLLMEGTTLSENIKNFEDAYEFFSNYSHDRVLLIDNSHLSLENEVNDILRAIQHIEDSTLVGITHENDSFCQIFGPEDYKQFCVSEPYKSYPNTAAKDWKYIETKTGKLIHNIYYDFVEQKSQQVLKELKRDPNSRQGIINYSYMFEFPCVVYSSHRIRHDELRTAVHCRSSDIERGFIFDLAWNSWIHGFIASELGLKAGNILFVSDSLHQYTCEPWSKG